MSHMRTAQDELVKKYNQFQVLNTGRIRKHDLMKQELRDRNQIVKDMQMEGSLEIQAYPMETK